MEDSEPILLFNNTWSLFSYPKRDSIIYPTYLPSDIKDVKNVYNEFTTNTQKSFLCDLCSLKEDKVAVRKFFDILQHKRNPSTNVDFMDMFPHNYTQVYHVSRPMNIYLPDHLLLVSKEHFNNNAVLVNYNVFSDVFKLLISSPVNYKAISNGQTGSVGEHFHLHLTTHEFDFIALLNPEVNFQEQPKKYADLNTYFYVFSTNSFDFKDENILEDAVKTLFNSVNAYISVKLLRYLNANKTKDLTSIFFTNNKRLHVLLQIIDNDRNTKQFNVTINKTDVQIILIKSMFVALCDNLPSNITDDITDSIRLSIKNSNPTIRFTNQEQNTYTPFISKILSIETNVFDLESTLSLQTLVDSSYYTLKYSNVEFSDEEKQLSDKNKNLLLYIKNSSMFFTVTKNCNYFNNHRCVNKGMYAYLLSFYICIIIQFFGIKKLYDDHEFIKGIPFDYIFTAAFNSQISSTITKYNINDPDPLKPDSGNLFLSGPIAERIVQQTFENLILMSGEHNHIRDDGMILRQIVEIDSTKFGAESAFGVVSKANVRGNNKLPFLLKTSRNLAYIFRTNYSDSIKLAEINNIYLQFTYELAICLVVNEIRYKVPNFMLTYGGFTCYMPVNNFDANIKPTGLCEKNPSWKDVDFTNPKTSNIKFPYIVTELITTRDPSTPYSMYRWLNNKLNNTALSDDTVSTQIKDFIKQLFAGLAYAQEKHKFTHHDAHQENILVHNILDTDISKNSYYTDYIKNKKYNLVLRYHYSNKQIDVNSHMIIPVFIDYGLATVDSVTNKPPVNEHDKKINRQYQYSGFSDIWHISINILIHMIYTRRTLLNPNTFFRKYFDELFTAFEFNLDPSIQPLDVIPELLIDTNKISEKVKSITIGANYSFVAQGILPLSPHFEDALSLISSSLFTDVTPNHSVIVNVGDVTDPYSVEIYN